MMADDNEGAYTIAAKPTTFRGVEYDSKLEARVAELLYENHIVFAPHQKFKVFSRTGTQFTYEIDFVFKKPKKLKGISYPINALEVKGAMEDHDIDRLEAFMYCYNVKAFIALPQLIDFWERCGVVSQRAVVWNRKNLHWIGNNRPYSHDEEA